LPAAPALSFEINTTGAGSLGVVRGNPTGTPLRLIGVSDTLGSGIAVRNRGWHHVAFTYNGGVNTSDLRLFVDGVEVTNFSSVDQENLPPPPAGTGTITLGSYSSSTGLDGALSDVGVWYGRELTDTEVLALANGSKTPLSLGGSGLVFGPSFVADLNDPVSGKAGSATFGVATQTFYPPVVRSGLIAAYDARVGFSNTGNGIAWTDASGGGNTLSQGTGSFQPYLLASGTPSGLPAVVFDPGTINTNGARWMATTAATNADLPSDNFTAVYVGSSRLIAGSGGGGGSKFLQCVISCPQFALRIGGPTSNSLRDSELAYTDSINANGVFAGTNVKAVSTPGFLAWRGNGAGLLDFTSMDRASSVSRTVSAAVNSSAWRLGAASSGNVNGFVGNAQLVLLYNRRLSDTELSTLRASLTANYAIPLPIRRVVVVEGSSSAAGYYATGNREYIYRSASSRYDVGYNFARGGDDVTSNSSTDVRQQAAQGADTVVRVGLPNILVLQIGSNDLLFQPSGNDQGRAQVVFNNIKQYCQSRKTAGFTRIGVITLLSRNAAPAPAGQAAFDNRRRILNDLLRQNIGQGYDEVIDFAAHSQLGADMAFSLYPWLYYDNTHLSDQGFDLAEPYLESFLSAPQPRVPDADPLVIK
ncbi:MAG: hypothetical protein K2Q09_00555, partial [Phycisphaerales bacterium]|nr:hypothetical protein [Phycisphaerales bacterium]